MQDEFPRSERAARYGAASAVAAVTLLLVFMALSEGEFDRSVMRLQRTVGVLVSVAGALWLTWQVLLDGGWHARTLSGGVAVVLTGVLVANCDWASALALGGMGCAVLARDALVGRARGERTPPEGGEARKNDEPGAASPR